MATSPSSADVDRRVHGQHVLRGQAVVHDPERALLDLAGVLGAADQDLLLGQVDEDDGLAARAVALRVGAEAGRIDDREVGHEVAQLFRAGADEQVVAEDARPGRLRVGAHRAPIARIGAHERVLDEDLALVDMVDEALAQGVVALLADGLIEAAPPDALVRIGFVDDVLVLGRAAGVLAGAHDQRPVGGEQALIVAQRVLVQGRRREVREARLA